MTTQPLISLFDWSARGIGEVMLYAIAATMVGYLISKIWPKAANPGLFAIMIPLFGLSLAAYWGSGAAAMAIVLFIALAIFAAVIGIA
ncbi:MAG TPA: hypothetical protein PK970_06205 [Hyphomicrobiaceae bacterium]|nr:hypothetical protein [Hyphomicrobiaceae bacterium]